MNTYRPRLPDISSWKKVIDIIKEIGPDELISILKSSDRKVEFNSKNDTIQYMGSRVTNLDDLKEHGKINTDKWEISKYIENFWGNDLNPNWQVKAWLQRKGLEEPDKSWTKKWLDELIDDMELPEVPISKLKKDPIVVVIADLHIGVINRDDRVVPTYNKEVCFETVISAMDYVNEHFPDRPVHLMVLGDLIESFTGKNHKGTWKQIELHGAKAAFAAFDVLKAGIKRLDNFQKLYLISGNHDRVTAHREADEEGQVTELVYGIFKRITNIPVVYDPMVLSVNIDDIQYIMLHGHQSLAKKKAAEIVQQYGSSDCFNLIMNGHKHHKEFIEDTYKARYIRHPSIVTGTPFSLRIGENSRSGFAIHEKSKCGSVDSHFIDL